MTSYSNSKGQKIEDSESLKLVKAKEVVLTVGMKKLAKTASLRRRGYNEVDQGLETPAPYTVVQMMDIFVQDVDMAVCSYMVDCGLEQKLGEQTH